MGELGGPHAACLGDPHPLFDRVVRVLIGNDHVVPGDEPGNAPTFASVTDG